MPEILEDLAASMETVGAHHPDQEIKLVAQRVARALRAACNADDWLTQPDPEPAPAGSADVDGLRAELAELRALLAARS